MSDRQKMIRFISSQLPHGEGVVTLGGDSTGWINAHVRVMGDDIEIISDWPEWVTLREVYCQLRWDAMPGWEQTVMLRSGQARAKAPAESRLEHVASRMEAYLASVAKSGGDIQPTVRKEPNSPARRNLSDDQAMTTREVADLLGCSYTEARERLLDGRIKAVKDGRWLRTRREWVEEYLARKAVRRPAPDVHSVPAPRKRREQATLKKGGIGYRFLKSLSP
jgi:excisionase family DNA binding protein